MEATAHTGPDVGRLIRETRERHGLSQQRLARRAGTTQAVVSRIERGAASPSFDTVQRLLGALGWELDMRLRRSRWQDDDADALRAFGALAPQERLRGLETTLAQLSAVRGVASGTPRRDG